MSTHPYIENPAQRVGVETNVSAYLTPYGNNKLPEDYPSRDPDNNKALDPAYRNKAFGTGNNENPYKNNYKGRFDNRYPSIWRNPQAERYVRGLDDWEKAIISAVLGTPWSPTVSGTVTTSPTGSVVSGTVAEPTVLDLGPITLSETGTGTEPITEPISSDVQGGAITSSGNIVNLYVAITDNKKSYFIKSQNDNSLKELTINNNNLEIFDPVSNKTLQSSVTVDDVNNLITNNNFTVINDNTIKSSITTVLDASMYDTGYKLTSTDDKENYSIYYKEYPESIFFISYNDTNEYEIGAYSDNINMAYFNYNNEILTFNIKDNSDKLVTFNDLSNFVSDKENLKEKKIEEINPMTITLLDKKSGGKYKKNKNKSRRFKKHFRKTRKSHKE